MTNLSKAEAARIAGGLVLHVKRNDFESHDMLRAQLVTAADRDQVIDVLLALFAEVTKPATDEQVEGLARRVAETFGDDS